MPAMPVLSPINPQQEQQVIDATRRYIDSGNQLLALDCDYLPVVFDLRGRAAGMFKISRGQARIRYNPWLFARYFEENYRTTIPHEVAHYLIYRQYAGSVRPHGREWQALMQAFSADSRRTVDFDLHGVPQRHYRRYPYACGCRTHELTSRRHLRIKRREARYHCRQCGDLIRPAAGHIEGL